MSLKSDLNGTFTLEELDRLTWPVAWSGTKDQAEAAAEEAELRAFARETKKQLQDYYNECGDGEADYAVRVVDGEVIEIVEV